MPTSNSEYVIKAFNATQFRNPTTEEQNYWTEELDLGYMTPSSLFFLGAQQSNFLGSHLLLAQTFKALFGRFMTTEESLIWGSALHSGATIQQVVAQILTSTELNARLSIGQSIQDKIKIVYETATGVEMTNTQAAQYESELINGQISLEDLALEIGSKTPELTTGLALIHAALYEQPPIESDLTGHSENVKTALSELFETFKTNEALIENQLSENSGTLELPAENFNARIFIDLVNNTIKSDGQNLELSSGSIANIVTIDARELTEIDVKIDGSTVDETFYGSNNGDVIQMGGGNDTIYLGQDSAVLNEGIDIITFESNPENNGADNIYNFTVGANKDQLDFSKFLTATGTSMVNTPIYSNSTASNSAWSNGDIIVINGVVDSEQDVIDLFGVGSPLAPPNSAGKLVIISAGVIGDANIWSIVNQNDLTQVTSSEVELIGILKDVNSFDIKPLDTTNFL